MCVKQHFKKSIGGDQRPVIHNSRYIIAQVLGQVMALPYRKDTNITYGKVISDYTLSMPDLRFIVMKRLDYVFARASKKCKVDIA